MRLAAADQARLGQNAAMRVAWRSPTVLVMAGGAAISLVGTLLPWVDNWSGPYNSYQLYSGVGGCPGGC